jgi:hypothetical protein
MTACFYWKLAFTRDYVWFDHPDMLQLEIPRLQYQARQMHGKDFPLWNPRIWAGQPHLGQTQPGPVYPLNLLLCLLPLRDGFLRMELLNWYWIVVHFLAALFCYWLARDLGAGRAAALAAGIIFSFGGFVATVAWLDVVNGAVWTPLIALFLMRALRGHRTAASAALSGICLGLAWLSGHHEVPLLVSTAVALTWLVAIFRRGRPDPKLLRAAALSLAIAALVSAVQLWPTLEFGRRSVRWIGVGDAVAWNERVPYSAATFYSLPARGLVGTLLPTMGREAGDSSPFLGVVAVSAAVLGVVVCWSDPRVRWLAVLAAAAAVYALGALTPFHGVVYALVPLFNKARIPVRGLHLFHFSVAMLAAFGIDALLNRRESVWVRRSALVAAGLGTLIFAAAVVARTAPDDRVMLSGLIALATAAVWFAWRAGRLGRSAVASSVAALLLIELYGPATAWFSDRDSREPDKFAAVYRRYDDLAAVLFREPGPVRALVNDQDVPFNFGDWYGIDMIFGYVAGVTDNVVKHPLHTARTQDLFGITHLVAKKPDRPEQQEIFSGASGVKVFRNPGALPRAWAVHDTVRVKNRSALLDLVQDASFDPRRTAAMLGPAPQLESCTGADEVRLAVHDPDRVIIDAGLPCRGMVVLSETMFPGWRATVDGKPAAIHEAFGVFRAVVVEAGKHRVDLAYRPVSVYGGLALTIAGLLIAAAVVLRDTPDA